MDIGECQKMASKALLNDPHNTSGIDMQSMCC